MATIITLEVFLATMESLGLTPGETWIVVAPGEKIRPVPIPWKELDNVPLENRLGGICSYVRCDELLDLVYGKFGIDHVGIRISPLIRRLPDNSIRTDITIDAGHVTIVLSAHSIEIAQALTP